MDSRNPRKHTRSPSDISQTILADTSKLLAVVLFQVIYTLLNYGGALPTWLTPFHVLVADGSSGSGSSGTKSRASKSYGGRSGQDTSDTWEQVGGPSGPTSQRGPGA